MIRLVLCKVKQSITFSLKSKPNFCLIKCLFYFQQCSISLFSSNMEGLPVCHNNSVQLQVTSTIDCILEQTFAQIKTRRLNHIMAHEMPEDYLKYISNVSMLLHSHREPANTRVLQKMITEPTEADSHQLHHPLPQRKIQHRLYCLQDQELPQSSPPPEGRKQSMCLSHRSRISVERLPTRKIINSRRKIHDNNRLIPLNRATEFQDRNEAYEEKITQLRKRKVKLEQAMRAFREQDRSQRIAEYKKSKENQALFTTDFKGKVLNFNPKMTKGKSNETIPFIVKFQTLVQSGRSWANWGKVSSNTRRNFFRDNTNDRGVSEADLS